MNLWTIGCLFYSQTTSASDVFIGKVDALGRAYATGRRKTSVARVWIKEGSGEFVINNKNSIEYFQPIQREHCIGPFVETNTAGLFDIWCTVKGGGVSGQCSIHEVAFFYRILVSGQAGAIRLGISRALVNFMPHVKPPLRRGTH